MGGDSTLVYFLLGSFRMEVAGMFSEWFWDESFWLPGNVSWKSLERNDEEYYPQVSDLKIVFPLAGFLYFVRCVWERSVALHIGRYYNIKEQTPRKIPYNEVLEQAFRKHGKTFPLPDIAKVLAQEANMTYGQAERWWRKRAIHSKPAKMQRFTETCWRFLYYFLSFWSGLFVLWNKPWLWDTKECWNGFPKQHVSMDIRIYYMIQLSFYVSLIFSLFKDVRRKDFQQMIVHHFATVLLMVMSWCNNMVRVGSLVLCLHDTVDYWLEGAKLANYLHYNKVCDVLFLIFALLWFVSRLVIYPLRILNSTWFECHELLGDFTSHYIFNILLSLLFILHIIWFCTIMKMVLKFMVKGKVEKDGRSDTESSSSSEEATKTEDGNYYYGTEDHNVRLRASLKNLESEFGKNKNGVVS